MLTTLYLLRKNMNNANAPDNHSHWYLQGNLVKKNKNITPSFKELTKLGVFAGLCVGLSAPTLADTVSNTSNKLINLATVKIVTIP